MARQGYKIFDAHTHLYEPVEQIEAYLSAADRARLDAPRPAGQTHPGQSRHVALSHWLAPAQRPPPGVSTSGWRLLP